jgi:hypothetical protein
VASVAIAIEIEEIEIEEIVATEAVIAIAAVIANAKSQYLRMMFCCRSAAC